MPRVLEIVARRGALDAGELLVEPVLRRLHHLVEPGRPLRLLLRARIGRGDLHAGGVGQLLHRVHEGEAAASVSQRIASPCAPQPKQW